MSGVTDTVLYVDEHLGRIFVPQSLAAIASYPGSPARSVLSGPGREVGIFVAKQRRPVFVDGHMHEDDCDASNCSWRAIQAFLEESLGDARRAWKAMHEWIVRYSTIWSSITHNERVDVGAAIQFNLVFGTSGTTANGVLTAQAVANATLTKTKTDLSLGSASANVTTNEFTATGLARAAGTLGTYTAPASLGATASQVITKTFTATGSATATGGGLFDQVTVSGSHLYVEDNYSSNAVLVNGDTLTQNVTVTN